MYGGIWEFGWSAKESRVLESGWEILIEENKGSNLRVPVMVGRVYERRRHGWWEDGQRAHGAVAVYFVFEFRILKLVVIKHISMY